MLSIVILLFGSHEYILFNFDCVSISIQKKLLPPVQLFYASFAPVVILKCFIPSPDA
jgi:hypothetical protein